MNEHCWLPGLELYKLYVYLLTSMRRRYTQFLERILSKAILIIKANESRFADIL